MNYSTEYSIQRIYQQQAGKLKKLFTILKQKRSGRQIQSVMKIVCNYLNFWVPVGDTHSKSMAVLIWDYSEAHVTSSSTLDMHDERC